MFIINNKKGFTLVELMILLVIVSLLIAAAAPMITRSFKKVPQRVMHGRFVCLRNATGGTDQYLYNATKLVKKEHNATNTCSFKPSTRATAFNIEMMGAGSGGNFYKDIEDITEESKVLKYDPTGGGITGDQDVDGFEITSDDYTSVFFGNSSKSIGPASFAACQENLEAGYGGSISKQFTPFSALGDCNNTTVSAAGAISSFFSEIGVVDESATPYDFGLTGEISSICQYAVYPIPADAKIVNPDASFRDDGLAIGGVSANGGSPSHYTYRRSSYDWSATDSGYLQLVYGVDARDAGWKSDISYLEHIRDNFETGYSKTSGDCSGFGDFSTSPSGKKCGGEIIPRDRTYIGSGTEYGYDGCSPDAYAAIKNKNNGDCLAASSTAQAGDPAKMWDVSAGYTYYRASRGDDADPVGDRNCDAYWPSLKKTLDDYTRYVSVGSHGYTGEYLPLIFTELGSSCTITLGKGGGPNNAGQDTTLKCSGTSKGKPFSVTEIAHGGKAVTENDVVTRAYNLYQDTKGAGGVQVTSPDDENYVHYIYSAARFGLFSFYTPPEEKSELLENAGSSGEGTTVRDTNFTYYGGVHLYRVTNHDYYGYDYTVDESPTDMLLYSEPEGTTPPTKEELSDGLETVSAPTAGGDGAIVISW